MRILRSLGALLLSTTAAVVATPAPAQAAACGSWWPGGGRLTAEYVPSTRGHSFREFVATTTFTYSQAEIDALRCTGSSALEVDVLAYGGLRGGGVKSGSSTMPDSYLDTEFRDGYPRVLTEGTRSARKLRAGVEYQTRVRLVEISPRANYAELYVNFQRGHWARRTNAKEQLSCQGHGGSDPAWCVFGDRSATMAPAGKVPPRISLASSYRDVASVSWGSYRATGLSRGQILGSGDRLNSPNGLNSLVMQADGNLVERIPGGRVVWHTGTGVPGSILRAQEDGNFVVIAPGNRPVWSTRTAGRPGSVLQLQNDRNLVVYAPGHRAVWSNAVAGGA